MSSSSLSFSLNNSEPSSISLSSDNISNIDPNLYEFQQLTRRQNMDSKRIQKELLHSDRKSKKWMKAQVETVAAIKAAELEAKQFELERSQAENNIDLANKDAEIDSKMRDIDSECGNLRLQIQQLEITLGEIKDSRKRDLLNVRSEIQAQLNDMRQKEIQHSKQIDQLQTALKLLVEKHENDLGLVQENANSSIQVVDLEIQRVQQEMQRCRKNLSKADQVHSKRVTEADQTIEMLKNEIASSYERVNSLSEEYDETQAKLVKLQQALIKADETSRMNHEQLQMAEQHKIQLQTEFSKIDRALWNNRKNLLLQTD